MAIWRSKGIVEIEGSAANLLAVQKQSQDPAFVADVVFVEDAQAVRFLAVGTSAPPGLERTRILNARESVEIERLKN